MDGVTAQIFPGLCIFLPQILKIYLEVRQEVVGFYNPRHEGTARGNS